MRITSISEKTVSTATNVRNSSINFDDMTASALVVTSDQTRDGRPLVGLAFDSSGRHGHGGLLRERFIPRLLNADSSEYIDSSGGNIDAFKVRQIAMRNEKPGGHGERSGAIGLLDAAIWDLIAKIEGKALWRVLGERFGATHANRRIAVYATCGYYRREADLPQLRSELLRCMDLGFRNVKIKVGGSTREHDLDRIETAISVIGDGARIAVDCNGMLGRDETIALFSSLEEYKLAWVEEPVDPLDYALYKELAQITSLPIAVGENIFSFEDTRNLLRYGGLRRDKDYLQMDVSLSYGITEYLRIVELAESAGWSRCRIYPHGGHALSMQVVAGLGLGAHEVAPFGALASHLAVTDGFVLASDSLGVGIEERPALYAMFSDILG